MAATVVPGQAPQGHHSHQPPMLPLYDLFLDLPHPAGTTSVPPPFTLPAPATTPEMEKELTANLSRIARFAFPEFDDAISKQVPRDSLLNRFSQYAMQPKTFQHYTFSLQLQSGVRLHGHVRRYLPIHLSAKSRYDIGRRGERALVLLTRVNGGDLVYSAILKTVDALSFQNLALTEKQQAHREPQKWFLTKLFDQHRQLCSRFASLPFQERKPMILNIRHIEGGEKNIQGIGEVDMAKFLIPTSLLSPTPSVIESVTSASILPLLRTLGVENTLRLLSAMLSESRILLISHSPTRLAQCARSALSILAQGLLNWQHLYIPVLPPHLFQYLAAPVPYLIGILTSLAPRLDQDQSGTLGEVVIINLDQCRMETRGINPDEVDKKIPDLFRRVTADAAQPQGSMSSTEMLAQDLLDLLKIDKRTLNGESGLTNVAETAVRATKAVKSGFKKLKNKGKKFLQQQKSSSFSDDSGDELDDGADADPSGQMTLLPDFIYTQGAQNEQAEEEARIAFTSFFLAMFGNMRWYLSASPGKLPELNRQRFMQQKRSLGDGEYSAMWPLLQNFCQTQMLEQFAKARVEEVRTRLPVTAASSLFSQCTNYHRLHNIDFGVINVRRVARQVAQNNPSRTILQTSARRMAMTLTSNKTFEGDYNKSVSQLVEQCRECSSVLSDVMSVIWVRLRDCKGLHWKHGFQALQVLRNLLYHGPTSIIAEATDGLDKIRMMKFYNDNMRSQICTQIRQAASQVYNLLVDRAKLFNIRRACINKRRVMRKQDQGRYTKESRMKVITPFAKIHGAFNPRARAQVAPVNHFGGEHDLLGMTAPAGASPASIAASNPFEMPTSHPTAVSQGNAPKKDAAQDILSLFENVSVSQPPGVLSNSITAAGHDPFAATPSPVAQKAPTPLQTGAANVAPAKSLMVQNAAASVTQPNMPPLGQHAFGAQPSAVAGHTMAPAGQPRPPAAAAKFTQNQPMVSGQPPNQPHVAVYRAPQPSQQQPTTFSPVAPNSAYHVNQQLAPGYPAVQQHKGYPPQPGYPQGGGYPPQQQQQSGYPAGQPQMYQQQQHHPQHAAQPQPGYPPQTQQQQYQHYQQQQPPQQQRPPSNVSQFDPFR